MIKKTICIILSIFVLLGGFSILIGASKSNNDYIKYVEFNVTYEALKKAMQADIDTYYEDIHINWIDTLAYLGAKYGGDFKKYKSSDLDSIIEKLKNGEKINTITKDMEYFNYYKEAYTAVLDGFLGTYTENDESKYGLIVYSPIAKTFPYSHYDDFGASRQYGYDRMHLGHDLMCATGTPIIAIESGIVEIMGWNEYGGWRIGIRSLDSKRYYYYAHLRQNRPYHIDVKEGSIVTAGDVIGYAGRTGYSKEENVNGIETSHLHLGLELVFDESQKESENEIWINLYAITKLLSENTSSTTRVAETKEYYSNNAIKIDEKYIKTTK